MKGKVIFRRMGGISSYPGADEGLRSLIDLITSSSVTSNNTKELICVVWT